MKKFLKPLVFIALAVAVAFVPLARAQAQNNLKPVAVISINGLNEIFDDVTAVTKWAGVDGATGFFLAAGRGLTTGLDQKRPNGAYVVMENGEPKVVAFLPVTNLAAFLNIHKDRIGTPKDLGDGVLQLAGNPQTIYVKEQAGWAFVAQDQNQLTNLLQNPVELLAGLDKKYDIGIRFYIQNIPAEIRDLAVSRLKDGYEAAMQQQSGQLDAQQRAAAEKLGQNSIKSLVQLIEEADQVTIGLSIDAQEKQIFLEGSATAKAGTELAGKMALLADAKSAFTGFLIPEAAATFNFSQKMAADDVEQMLGMLKVAREQALKQIDNEAKLPDQNARTAAKDIVGALLDIVRDTVQKGKIDGGAALVLDEDEVQFVAGGLVADGTKLESTLKKIVELAKNEPDFPGIKFNADSHKGVSFHTIKVPIDDKDAAKIFGEELEIVIGTGKSSVFVGVGDDTITLLKEVIDNSIANGNKAVPPMQFSLSIRPILKFAASVENNPQIAALAAAAEAVEGNDHITVTAKPIERGLSYRLEIEEGILKIFGEAAKSAQGGRL